MQDGQYAIRNDITFNDIPYANVIIEVRESTIYLNGVTDIYGIHLMYINDETTKYIDISSENEHEISEAITQIITYLQPIYANKFQNGNDYIDNIVNIDDIEYIGEATPRPEVLPIIVSLTPGYGINGKNVLIAIDENDNQYICTTETDEVIQIQVNQGNPLIQLNTISSCSEQIRPTETIEDTQEWDYELIKTKWYLSNCDISNSGLDEIHSDLNVDIGKSTFRQNLTGFIPTTPAIAISRLKLQTDE